MATFDTQPLMGTLAVGATAAAAAATVLMDTPYITGVSGEAVGVRFIAPGNVSISNVYAVATTRVGAANIQCDILGAHPTSVLLPNASDFIDGANSSASPSGWLTFSGFGGATLTAGEPYWVAVGVSNGLAATRSYTVAVDGGPSITAAESNMLASFTTTNGWFSEAGSATRTCSPIIIKFSDGTYFGNPYYDNTANTGTPNKGFVITPAVDMTLIGVTWSDALTTVTHVDVFLNGALPGTTPYSSHAMTTAGLLIKTAYFTSPVTLTAGQTHRIVLRYGSSGSFTTFTNVRGAQTTDTRNCTPHGGIVYYTAVSGAAWADDPDKFPVAALLFRSTGSASGSVSNTRPWSSRPSSIYRP